MFKTSLALGVAATAALAAPASAQNWTAELYGGAVFDRSEEYGGVSAPLSSGTTYGFGIYERNLVPGVELGFDLMHGEADYSGTGTGVEANALMLNARLPFELAPGTTAYVGAGFGAIDVTFDGGAGFPALSGSDTVPGGQIGLGIRYDFSAFTAFGELKHQMAFEDALIQGARQSFDATSAVVGLRFAF